MVSAERVLEYQTEVPQEAAWTKEGDPPADWLREGRIRFHDYQTRYREGLELILKGVSLDIRSQEKVGIVGRTGAGKSSLTLSLFRIIEATSGSIWLDDVDISQIGLGTLRSQMTIIPQVMMQTILRIFFRIFYV